MDKIQKPSDNECNVPSSQPFGIDEAAFLEHEKDIDPMIFSYFQLLHEMKVQSKFLEMNAKRNSSISWDTTHVFHRKSTDVLEEHIVSFFKMKDEAK
jgi:hypothetical protein